MEQTTRQKVNDLVLEIIRQVLNSEETSNKSIPTKNINNNPTIGPGEPGGAKIIKIAASLFPTPQQKHKKTKASKTTAALKASSFNHSTFFIEQEMEESIRLFTGGDHKKKRTYLISFSEADRLISQSPSEELALRVVHMNDPDKLEASWVSFDEETAKKDGSLVTYIWLAKKFFGPDGRSDKNNFKSTDHNYDDMIITARFGKSKQGLVSAYLIAGKIDYITSPGGDNPMGATTGAKIPPG